MHFGEWEGSVMCLYDYHCENLRQIENAIGLISRELKDSISKEDENEVKSYTRLLTYLLSCWTEVRLYKIIEETHNNRFTDAQKKKILKTGNRENNLENKWKNTISIAMCQAFNIPETTDQTLIKQHLENDEINHERYNNIIECLNDELSMSILLRNKVAHGQWVHALNNGNTAINEDTTNEMHNINIVEIQLQHKMYESLANIINDLVVSPPTFERDFNKNYSTLMSNKNNFHKRDYETYKIDMIKKFERGRKRRSINLNRKYKKKSYKPLNS